MSKHTPSYHPHAPWIISLVFFALFGVSLYTAPAAPVHIVYANDFSNSQADVKQDLFLSYENIVTGMVVANELVTRANDAMLMGYMQTGAQFVRAVAFNIDVAHEVWDYTFGSFGESLVREMYALNNIQVDLYARAGASLSAAFEAPPVADSSISVASIALAL